MEHSGYGYRRLKPELEAFLARFDDTAIWKFVIEFDVGADASLTVNVLDTTPLDRMGR